MAQRAVHIIPFADEVTPYHLPAIMDGVDALIHSGGTRFVFNLKKLKLICSPALGYMIQTQRRLRELKGELVLSEPSQHFESLVTALGIDQVFRVCASDREALRHFGHDGDDDGSGGVQSRLKPWQPSDSGLASPDGESRDT